MPAAAPTSALGLLGHRGQIEHLYLGPVLRKRNDQPPHEGRDAFEHPGNVTPRIVAISARFLLVAKSKAAEEDHSRRNRVGPQASRGPLAAGLFDDREQFTLDVNVTEEGFELL